ncbi:MAG: hypothetical protein PUA62_07990 [Lachnospiraceae bacterium]|nr:hypothetical protein [Lachnospiraceae bacterium]
MKRRKLIQKILGIMMIGTYALFGSTSMAEEQAFEMSEDGDIYGSSSATLSNRSSENLTFSYLAGVEDVVICDHTNSSFKVTGYLQREPLEADFVANGTTITIDDNDAINEYGVISDTPSVQVVADGSDISRITFEYHVDEEMYTTLKAADESRYNGGGGRLIGGFELHQIHISTDNSNANPMCGGTIVKHPYVYEYEGVEYGAGEDEVYTIDGREGAIVYGDGIYLFGRISDTYVAGGSEYDLYGNTYSKCVHCINSYNTPYGVAIDNPPAEKPLELYDVNGNRIADITYKRIETNGWIYRNEVMDITECLDVECYDNRYSFRATLDMKLDGEDGINAPIELTIYYTEHPIMDDSSLIYAENDGCTFYKRANGDVVSYYANGTMVINEFKCDGTYTYYFQADGTAMRDRLTYHPDGVHVIYFDEDGHEVFSDFAHITKTIAGKTVDDYCFFDSLGHMYVDTMTYDKTGTKLYYINPYGLLEHAGWFAFSGKEFDKGLGFSGRSGGYGYANPDGSLYVNANTYDWEGRLCYLQGDGHMFLD